MKEEEAEEEAEEEESALRDMQQRGAALGT